MFAFGPVIISSTSSGGSSLPSQTGHANQLLATNATVVSWQTIDYVLPSQTGNANCVLQSNGTTSYWADIVCSDGSISTPNPQNINLAMNHANTWSALQTFGYINITGQLRTPNMIATSGNPSNIVGRLPIYDASGNELGSIPIYQDWS